MTKSSFLALATAGVFLCLPAYAQGAKEEGHDANHDVYKEWMMPGSPGVSCCQEKKNGVGDCYPTDARTGPAGAENPGVNGPVWYARKLPQGIWVEIPEKKIIRERNPDPTGSRAHLCMMDWEGAPVLCFVPPMGGT